ncbi:MAG TPA: acyltransferase [Vicinamibacterales bacterium]|nr:acyltransferase [Vicinamibacterales bacterium]
MAHFEAQRRRLPSLDGWRAVAIALVLLSHFEAARGFPTPSWWSLAFQGELGVRMFFVISGLLITYLLLIEADRSGRVSLRSFYTRRALRILPVYFLYLGVVATLAIAGLYADTTTAWIGSLTFTRNLMGRTESLTGHYWSLAVEEQFYLIWPVTLVVLGLWRRPRVAAVLLLIPIVACPILRTGIVQAHWPNPFIARGLNVFSIAVHADSLAVGCLGAFIFWRCRDRLTRLASRTTLSGALIVFVVAAASERRVGAAEPLLPLIESLAILCVMYVTIERRRGGLYRLLNAKPIVWLGVLSYSLYVWQTLFLSYAAGPTLSSLAVYDWRVWWLAALVCACASYYIVERPILAVRDKLRDQVNRSPVTPMLQQDVAHP